MGRLFWKFFFFFWLAQFVTTLGVGIAIWALRPEHPEQRPPPPMPLHDIHEMPPPPPPRWMPPVMPLVAGGLVSLMFAALLAGYFSRPIRSLRGAFSQLAEGHFETRIRLAMGNRQDELAALGQDFDRMAEQLQALNDSQRRLLHDVSHELRSPLARLQAAADLMRQQPLRSEEFVARMERDIARMDQLVGALLTLARLDAGLPSLGEDHVNLGELIDEIAEDAQLEAAQRQVELGIELDDTLVTPGNPELLRRAIENVLRNALRFSPARGRIRLVAFRCNGMACIEITDQGPGIAEHDLERVFQPFQRSAASDAGFGLGLAIARRVVEAHHGSIHAANLPTGGLTISLTLPLV